MECRVPSRQLGVGGRPLCRGGTRHSIRLWAKGFAVLSDTLSVGKARFCGLSTGQEKIFKKKLKLLASTPIRGLNANIMGAWG